MTKRYVTERRFKCECGLIYTAFKKSNRETKVNHIKDIYCYQCKEIKKMTQLAKWY